MRWCSTTLVFVTGTLCVTACDGAGGDDYIPPQQFCNEEGEAVCDFMFRCFSQDELVITGLIWNFTDQASCPSAMARSCEDDLVAGVAAARQSYNGAMAVRCVDDFPDEACRSFIEDYVADGVLGPQSCVSASEGLVPQGSACVSSADCAPVNAQCINSVCSGTLGGDAFEIECSEATAYVCPGLTCMPLVANLQNMTGVCTAQCSMTWQCGPGAGCYRREGEDYGFCLSDCTSDGDCGGGFVCRVAGGAGELACIVDVAE